MTSEKIIYPAKVLLFGEYTVVHGSDSLAIPFGGFSAQWKYDRSKTELRASLLKYIEFLEESVQNVIDTQKLRGEYKNGLYLASDIPTGYGAGSSGSLVAAIYDRFALFKELDFEKLRKVFQWMESYFHGSSSGIDPLVSYLKKAIYIKDGKLNIIEIPQDNVLLGQLYLWDSKVSRKTAPLVSWYKEQLLNPKFEDKIENQLKPANTKIIEKFIEEDSEMFSSLFKQISSIQNALFTRMIDAQTVDRITALAEKNDILVKLCGAGGGGFFLVYVPTSAEGISESLLALKSYK